MSLRATGVLPKKNIPQSNSMLPPPSYLSSSQWKIWSQLPPGPRTLRRLSWIKEVSDTVAALLANAKPDLLYTLEFNFSVSGIADGD